MYVCGTCALAHIWKSEDNFYVDSWDQTQVARLFVALALNHWAVLLVYHKQIVSGAEYSAIFFFTNTYLPPQDTYLFPYWSKIAVYL